MAKFSDKATGAEVEAIKFVVAEDDSSNREEVDQWFAALGVIHYAWSPPHGHYQGGHINLVGAQHPLVFFGAGEDWIVQGADGIFASYTDADFEASYQAVTE